MKTLVICHISTPALRRLIRGKVKNYGFALSRGLFECELDERELKDLGQFLSELPYTKNDCVRIYPLCQTCREKGLSFGRHYVSPPQTDWIIF